jgi:hypothetical protein
MEETKVRRSAASNPQSSIPNPQSPILNPQSPIPNPQSPIPNPQSPIHVMPSLAQTLQATTPVSSLLRKARRLGLRGMGDLIALAVARGCTHYQSVAETTARPVDASSLANDELTILLLVGENPFEPIAIRCAAQLARSKGTRPERLARLAIMEKCERVLAHIARAGAAHDPEGAGFWNEILRLMPHPPAREEANLPHWSRFVSMPGFQRHGPVPPTWLTPHP